VSFSLVFWACSITALEAMMMQSAMTGEYTSNAAVYINHPAL